MTLIQSLDAKAIATGDSDLARLIATARDRLERFDEIARALEALVKASRATIAFQVRPDSFSEALERADRTLEELGTR